MRRFFAVMCILGIACAAQAKYSGGSGTEVDPYLIATAADMNSIGADSGDWNKRFKMIADVNMSGYTGTQYQIIGNSPDYTFSGVFDGDGHIITNFTYTSTGRDYVGIFGRLTGEGQIKNLGVVNCNVNANDGNYAGGLIGRNYNNCQIYNCFVTGHISGGGYVGGLAGENNGFIFQCFSNGSVIGTKSDIGGLVGRNVEGKVYNCYSTAGISGGRNGGGLVGLNWESDGVGVPATILNCYAATGSISGTFPLGALVGQNLNGIVTNSFWDSKINLPNNGIGTPKTTSEMQLQSTFTAAGWDFAGETLNGNEDIWTICDGQDYPKLFWEQIECLPRYSGGTGEPNNPYLIFTSADMNTLGSHPEDWHKYFKLMDDIDLSAYTGTQYKIIGTDSDNAFFGVFDGDGHIITNFTYTSTGRNYIGLFGYLKGQIKNLGVVNCNVSAGDGDRVGGLLGATSGGANVYNCFITGSVSGDMYVGGLAGTTSGRTSNCYSMAEVSGTQYVGGLIGMNFDLVMRCYSTGYVTGTLDEGGLIGYTYRGVIYNSYWDILTSGQTTSNGGRGKTTSQLKLLSTYLGWGVENAWKLDAGMDYPRLIWENKLGQNIIDPAPCELYGGGTGTSEEPYLIYTPEQFNNIGLFWKDWDKHFKLMSDIDLSVLGTETYNIIGAHFDIPFMGSFDGCGHTISGLYYTEGKYLLGLWGYIYSDDSVIQNITLINPQIISPNAERIGSLAAYLGKGTVINCHVKNGIISGQANLGGLVGRNSGGYIISSSADCNVAGPAPSVSGFKERYGGLVGENNSYIYQCYSAGNIYGNRMVGGLVGIMYHGKVENCYSTADVTLGKGSGAAGLISDIDSAVVKNCYSTGDVNEGQGSNAAGLIAPGMPGSTVSNCFWDVNSSGYKTSYYGTGKTTALMKTKSTFTDAGWDFVGETINGPNDVWRMCVDGVDYPHFGWEYSSRGDFGCPDGTDLGDLIIFIDQWLLEELSYDLYQNDGKNVVNFFDWNVFANGWDGDEIQLANFSAEWLQQGAYNADIAPEAGGDGIVNMLDFAVFAEEWIVDGW